MGNNILVWSAKALLAMLVEDNSMDDRTVDLRRALRAWLKDNETLM